MLLHVTSSVALDATAERLGVVCRGLESALAAIPNSEYGLKETQSLE